jgi:hypothetical protein
MTIIATIPGTFIVRQPIVSGTFLPRLAVIEGGPENLTGYTAPPEYSYHVNSSTGNNSNSGLSAGAAWLTLAYAAANAPAGCTLSLAGHFYEQLKTTKAFNITSTTIFVPAVIDGTGVSISAFDGLIDIRGTSGTHLSGVHISEVTVQNAHPDGTHEYDCIHLRYVDNVEIDNVTTSNASNSGILAWNVATCSIHDNHVVDPGHSDSATALWEEAISVTGTDISIYSNTVENINYLGNLGCIGICAKEKSKRVYIYDNQVYNLTRSGVIYIDAWNAPITDQLEYVYIYDNYGEGCLSGIGVSAENAGYIRNVWAYNNIVYNHRTFGFILYGNVFNGHKSNIYFLNNLSFLSTDNGGGGFDMASDNISGDIVFANNVSYTLGHNGQFRCLDSVVGSVTYANNFAWGSNSYNPDTENTPPISEVLTGVTRADPLFIDPTGVTGFHVYAESPLIGAGIDMSLVFTVDKDGNTKTTPWDCGVYEEQSPPASPVPNIIFSDGFEDNTFNAWTGSSGTGMTITAGAALAGSTLGCNVNVPNATAKYKYKSGLNSTTGVLGISLRIHPNTLTMGSGDNFGVLDVLNTAGNVLLFFLLVKSGADYKVQVGHYTNAGSPAYDTNTVILDADNFIEIQAVRSGSGLSDGTIAIKINGTTVTGVTGIANDTRWAQVDQIRIGAGLVISIPATSTGDIYLDEVALYDDNVAWIGGSVAWDKKYYMDSASGNDASDGKSRATAWQTIAKVNATTINPDESVLLKCGQTWRGENIIMSYSGSSGHPITYGKYGTGANPIIDPTLEYNDFTANGGNVWKRTVTYSPMQVFEDGVRMTYVASTTPTAGHWYWASNVLYVQCSDSGNPNTGHVVEHAASWKPAVMFNSQAYITVDGIDIFRGINSGYSWRIASGGGFTYGSHDILTKNCHVSWTQFRGFDMGGYTDLGLSNITVQDNVVHDCTAEGIWMGNGSNIQALDNEIYNGKKDLAKFAATADHGGIISGIRSVDCKVKRNYVHDTYFGNDIYVENEATYPRPSNTLVEDNYVSKNQCTGAAFLDEGSNTTCINNQLIVSFAANAGKTDDGSDGLLFLHNTCVLLSGAGANWVFAVNNGTNTTLENNEMYHVDATPNKQMIGLYTAGATGFVSDYNHYFTNQSTFYFRWTDASAKTTLAAWQTASGQDAHSLSASDPLFVNAASDYHLQAGSPCINAGADLRATVPLDYDGTTRDANPDIGCFEKV